MNHSEPVYYDDRFDELAVDQDEEYREDMFLRRHYGHSEDDDTEDEDDGFSNAYHHQGPQDFHLDDVNDEVEGYEDEYDEVDMDQHNIQLLSGSLSIRSPFLDAIREEEDEEPVFTKPSSYPGPGSSRFLSRRSGDGYGVWSARNSPLGIAKDERNTADDQQQANFNNTNQSDSGKPRGPRPPIQLGIPRSGTTSSSPSLPKVTSGFAIPLPTVSQGIDDNQGLTESTIQDLEVKRVLEGAAALASGLSSASTAAPDLGNGGGGLETKSTDSTPLPSVVSVNTLSHSSSSSRGVAPDDSSSDPTVSFGQDTQKSIDDFFGMVKSDLDQRIQAAIQEVEQKFLQRVQRLEEHTAVLAGVPEDLPASSGDNGNYGGAKAGSLMESLTRPLPAHQNPGGSLALRKEILSHVTEKVGDLDLRVNQMEVLVSYKLVDIESKVRRYTGAPLFSRSLSLTLRKCHNSLDRSKTYMALITPWLRKCIRLHSLTSPTCKASGQATTLAKIPSRRKNSASPMRCSHIATSMPGVRVQERT